MGASLVLFVTGLCNRGCFYCPLSSARRNRDVIFANEREIESRGSIQEDGNGGSILEDGSKRDLLAEGTGDALFESILEEARLIGALGTGITGGEPILKLDLVCQIISALKREFGSDHHIHMYTGARPGHEVLLRLREAGLDEIRIHPIYSDWAAPEGLSDLLKEARSLGMEAGVEIPAVEAAPMIIRAVKDAGAFLNLNELEFSETNQEELKRRGFRAKNYGSGASGSFTVARKHFMDDELRMHYCSSRFKDAVQLRERLLRRSARVRRPFDIVTEDGTLIHGTIDSESGDLELAQKMLEISGVPEDMYSVVDDRIEVAGWILEEFSKELKSIGCTVALVERYPVERGLVVERIPL